MRRQRRYFGEECVALDVAMGTEAGSDAIEIAVVVAGVADELVGAFGGHGLKDLVKGLAVEVAGGGDADSPVGGEDARVADLGLAFESGFEIAEEFDLKTANAIAVAEGEAPGLFEGMADGADGVLLGDAQERVENAWEEVGVLVSVEVRDVDAGVLEFLDLSARFAFDVAGADFAAHQGLNEVDEGRAKGFVVGAEEGGDAFGW